MRKMGLLMMMLMLSSCAYVQGLKVPKTTPEKGADTSANAQLTAPQPANTSAEATTQAAKIISPVTR